MQFVARLIVLGLCFASFAGAAAAQDTPASPPVLDQVYACAQVSAENERLVCYDNAVGRLRQAQQSGDLVAVDRTQAQELRQDTFGFSVPNLSRLFGDDDESAEAGLALQIERVSTGAEGRPVFRMSNGQVWAQIQSPPNNRFGRAGASVTIRRAAMGSFVMSFEQGGSALRVRRQE